MVIEEKELKRAKLKAKIRETKSAALNKAKEVAYWARDNKELVAAAVPVVVASIAGAAKIGKGAIRHSNLRKEQQLKDLYCYDRSGGHYWKLKKKLSSGEWIQIHERKAQGEKLYDILASMNVLA